MLNPVRLKELVIGTKALEHEWQTRHLHTGNDWGVTHYQGQSDEWVLSYWDSRDHSHRSFLIERISACSPIKSILEIGCNCGPNLYLLAKKFPNAEIQGIDINPIAVEKGRELLLKAGITNVKLSVGKADELNQFKDQSFDVVFTDAVLIYVGPDIIEKVLCEIVRITRKNIVLVERQCDNQFSGRKELGIRFGGCWERNYINLLRKISPSAIIKYRKINSTIWPDERWSQSGVVIEIDLK
jgi:ubiquinone/menaquinone biosynthesis C-methylase UbiE